MAKNISFFIKTISGDIISRETDIEKAREKLAKLNKEDEYNTYILSQQ